MEILIVDQKISRTELAKIAEKRFGDLVKVVVDLSRGVIAIGGELHADEEALLLEQGSAQDDLWGINLYPAESGDGFVELDSMINIRPRQNNRSRGVEDAATRERIVELVRKLVTD